VIAPEVEQDLAQLARQGDLAALRERLGRIHVPEGRPRRGDPLVAGRADAEPVAEHRDDRLRLHVADTGQGEQAALEIGAVVRAVAAFFGTTPEALSARSRRRDVLVPRQLAMYLCREYTGASLAEIARAFGRDHPSVANAARRVERDMLERAPLRYQVEELAARLERLGRQQGPAAGGGEQA